MSIAYRSESLQTLKTYTHTRSRPSPQPEINQEMAMDISWCENPYFLLFGVLMSLLLVLAARVFLVLRNTGKPISPVSSQRPLHTLFVLGSGMPFLQSRPFFSFFWVHICLHFLSVFFLRVFPILCVIYGRCFAQEFAMMKIGLWHRRPYSRNAEFSWSTEPPAICSKILHSCSY